MAKDNTFNLVFDKFYQGMAPLAFVNPLTEVGGAGHAASMVNCDIINGDYLTQGPALAILTNGSQAGVVSERINCILDKAVTDSVTYGIGATKLFKITPTAVTSDANFPQAITNCTEGCSVQLLKSKLYYFFNKSSGGEIGMYDLATTFDHDWGSTSPTNAAALQNAPHPSDKKEDIMLFGNGRYVGVYIAETNTIDVDKLDFGADCEVADIVYNAGYWYIAVNSGVTGTNRSEGQIYLYDGSAMTSLLQDETGVGMQRIGFLYRINGIIYVVYQDITSTGVNIGYIVGSQISPLKKFVGTLPNYQQKTLYRNTILFHSSGNIFSAGAMIDDLPFQISQIADGGYANVGAIAAPFGTPMVASSETTAFTAAVDNIITSASHGLVNGDTVLLTTTTSLPGGLSLATLYYVISKTDNTFKVSLTLNGDEVDITSVGTGIHYWNRYKLAKFSGYDVNCSWRTIIVPTIQDGILGYIDSITVLTTSLGANASCSVSIEANQGINSSNTLTVTGADKRIHTLSALGLGRIEDLRIYLNWSEGNATNPCPIRKIFVKGHYLEG